MLLAPHYHLELVGLARGSMREDCKACALEENESHSYMYWHVSSMCVGGGMQAKLQKHQAQTFCCLNILLKYILKKMYN